MSLFKVRRYHNDDLFLLANGPVEVIPVVPRLLETGRNRETLPETLDWMIYSERWSSHGSLNFPILDRKWHIVSGTIFETVRLIKCGISFLLFKLSFN